MLASKTPSESPDAEGALPRKPCTAPAVSRRRLQRPPAASRHAGLRLVYDRDRIRSQFVAQLLPNFKLLPWAFLPLCSDLRTGNVIIHYPKMARPSRTNIPIIIHFRTENIHHLLTLSHIKTSYPHYLSYSISDMPNVEPSRG